MLIKVIYKNSKKQILRFFPVYKDTQLKFQGLNIYLVTSQSIKFSVSHHNAACRAILTCLSLALVMYNAQMVIHDINTTILLRRGNFYKVNNTIIWCVELSMQMLSCPCTSTCTANRHRLPLLTFLLKMLVDYQVGPKGSLL